MHPLRQMRGGLPHGLSIMRIRVPGCRLRVTAPCIASTFTRTALVADYLTDPSFYEPLVARIPLGRIAECDDLVGLAVFLASDASLLITGQNILVDGGVTATQ